MDISHQQTFDPSSATSVITADGRMVCPNCEHTNHVGWYKLCDRPAKYSQDLNQVYICPRKKGGCGHVFSPGDKELVGLLVAFLQGKLVWAEENKDKPEAKAEVTV